MKRVIAMCFMTGACLCFSACGAVNKGQTSEEREISISRESDFQPGNSEVDSGKGGSSKESSSEESNSNEEAGNTDKNVENSVPPSKEEVIAMRAVVLEGMTEEEIERLTENIKIANLAMESAYLNDNIFGKLSDSDSPYWQYFDKAGDIQLGWWYNRQIVDKDAILLMEGITETEFYEREYEPGMVYNRFDAANFI